MITRAVMFLSLATLLAVGTSLAPWAGPASTAFADDDRDLRVENVEIEVLLKQLKEITGYSMAWNPADKNIRGKKVTGGITLKGSSEEIFSAARALLTFYELVIIPVGPESNPIHLVMDARQTSSILKLKPRSVTLTEANLARYATQDGLFITTTIAVEHMTDLRNARNALTRIVTGQNIGNVTEVPSAKSFVVTDFAPNVVAIYRLLKNMDKPSSSSSTTGGTTVAIKLAHAKAEKVAMALLQLYGSRHVASKSSRQPVTSGPSAPRIIADGRTNQLLVSGTDDEIAKLRTAIALMDVRVATTQMTVQMIRLKRIRAAEASMTLMNLIRGAPHLWRESDSDAMPTIVSHNETNALLVTASAGMMASIRSLIEQMDAQE